MNKLFGTSKPKKEEPKSNINAPTLTETSAKVCDLTHNPFNSILNFLFMDRWTLEERSSRQKSMIATRSFKRSRNRWPPRKAQD